MAAVRVQLDSLRLTLHGVSAGVADGIAPQLERALAERLGRLGGEPLVRSDFSVRELRLPSIRVGGALDAAALAGIVADRLVEMLAMPARSGDEGRTG